ncbi:MAG: zf-HC2 domain-containing protein [Lacrimispora sp.]|uniref:zf-HC2 domain-containing protein n=1 Tax=Lacrimispora sp. TaxID=2719234 RepID=UPI0039E6D5CD
MKDERCVIVEELLPLYIENETSPEVTSLIEEHLKLCKGCNSVYKKMTTGIHISAETAKPDKRTVRYINGIKLWYLLCPLFALFLINMGWGSALRIYEGALTLFFVSCIASDVFHKGTWWDTECVQLQDEIREDTKKRLGDFYIRPFFIAIPAILVVLVLELPWIITYISYK